jgi:proline iminopeptidase
MSPADGHGAPSWSPVVIHHGLAVYRIGEGDPVLFMPGPHRLQRVGTRSGDALISGLRDLGRSVLTFDPPGSGASSRPAQLSMEEMHQCADEALSVLGVEAPLVAVGHSMGGLAALAFAITRPQRVLRLLLIGTGSGGDASIHAPGALWNRSHPRFPTLVVLGLLQTVWPRRAPEQIMMNFIERESLVDRSFSRPAPVGAMDWIRPRRGRTDWHRVARRLDYRPMLGRIAAPVLIMCGRHDPQYPLSCSEELVSAIPDARLVVFEQSGHYPFIEEEERFWSEVGTFLSEPV